jgi:hypothetical protein
MIAARAFGIFQFANQYKVFIESASAFFVQNIYRNVSLGAPFKPGALGCSP